MKARLLALILGACCLLWGNDSHAQFGRVKVRMQSGEVLPITELPWFRLQLNVTESQWKGYANTADWVITSAPRHCPFGTAFRLRWQGRLSDADISLAQTSCTEFQRKKYASGPAEVRESCDCAPVLRTLEHGTLPWSEALWESLDDALLLADEMRLALLLKASEQEATPVMFVLGSDRSGLFDLNHQLLCESSQSFSIKGKGIFAIVQGLIGQFGTALPVSCVGGRQGTVDFSSVHFSVLRGRMTGTAILQFDQGERHELQFP